MTVFSISARAPRLAHSIPAWMIAIVMLLPVPLFAHEGEDHGDEAKPPAVATEGGETRFELSSPEVELLGVVQADGRLTLYADRYATNEPIRNARIELESAGRKLALQPSGDDGSYRAAADWLRQPGSRELTVSVDAPGLEDLLIGTLVVKDSGAAEHGSRWRDYGQWVAAAAGLLVALVIALRWGRRRRSRRIVSWIVPLFAVLLAQSGTVEAHGDEDHGEPPAAQPAQPARGVPAAPATTAAARLTDGSLFVPKPVQRLLGIRTVLAEVGAIPRTVTLNGRVIADPNFSGRVQPTQAGRVVAPPRGFPTLGMRVGKGQVLAYIEPIADSIEKGNQRALLAELDANLGVAERRARRLGELVGSVPQKEIEAARAEAAGLRLRRAAVAASLFQREALRAPVGGMISRADVVSGQVVDAREILFEIVDPARLRVEAVAYDAGLAGQVAAAAGITAERQPLNLSFLGQGQQLREQALPLQFAIRSPTPPLNVGQPVEVVLQTRQSLNGIRVPQTSVSKNASGENTIWIHASAERFVPRRVTIQPLDAGRIAVLSGVHGGERVVTQGASLLAQIR